MRCSKNVRLAGSIGAAAMLLVSCGGAPAAAPASSAVAPAQSSAAAKPSTPPASAAAKPSAAPAGSAAKPSAAPASAAKPSGGPASSAAKPQPAGSGGATSQALSLKSAYTTTSGTTIPLWVAKDGGDFAQNGLDVSLSIIAPGAPILAALESGDVPIAEAGGQEIVNAEVNGATLVLVGGFGEKPTNSIYTGPSITKPEDLKGKTIGVSSIGAVSHVAGQLAIEKLGLKGQVKFIGTGGLPETIAAIQSGKVDGGVLSPPQTFEAAKQGLHEVVDVAKLDVRSQTAAIVTTRKYASEHPDVVERYLRAMIQSSHRAYTDKALTMQTIVKYARVTDPELASKTYDYFHDGELWGKDGVPGDAAIQTNLNVAAETSPQAKNFKPDQMVDATFIQKIKASGLIDQLWGK
jgi:ABC-type nitrate/sulfonate/bicarbonate transport system substrate-binding protein